jgi:hypothetical protein
VIGAMAQEGVEGGHTLERGIIVFLEADSGIGQVIIKTY